LEKGMATAIPFSFSLKNVEFHQKVNGMVQCKHTPVSHKTQALALEHVR
jgi:hypothetical protein